MPEWARWGGTISVPLHQVKFITAAELAIEGGYTAR
jgi:hypothetical protein